MTHRDRVFVAKNGALFNHQARLIVSTAFHPRGSPAAWPPLYDPAP